VLLFSFQVEAEGFFVEVAKFLGGFHPFGVVGTSIQW
jgi:hypothetical protein